MPVTAEIIREAEGQDLRDLGLIYDCDPDAPPEWLRAALHGEGSIIVAGRFNGRLLGAFMLSREDGHHRLARLQVRDITRGRGVARQLLELAQRELPEDVRRIRVDLRDMPELEPLFRRHGFLPRGTGEGTGELLWERP